MRGPFALVAGIAGVAAGLAAVAAPVKLPAGMNVPLELQHHVNSAYVPVGSPIYFRVSHDVKIEDQVLNRAGEDVLAVSATDHSAAFDGWQILRFCRDGETTLRFRGTNAGGETVDGSIHVHVKIKKKG
jgi:hypothetical protein